MAKIDFYSIEKNEKEAIFQAIAAERGMTSFAVEKDWWVSRILETVFQMNVAQHLLFKGGTSLSKAWKLIHRFSEDIDLADAGIYTTQTFFEKLKAKLRDKGFKELDFKVMDKGGNDQDPRVLEIYYANIIRPATEYIKPRIQIEVSCRSLREPFTIKSFGSFVDEIYTGRDFAAPLFNVPTVNPERTFLEKLFLLHEEFNRSQEKIRVDRLSRHLYDIYHLSQSGIAKQAFNNQELYETIVAHRHKFSRITDVDYNSHNPKTLNPIPIASVIDKWDADYSKMKEDMIYEDPKPSFENLINNLVKLRDQLQDLNWSFQLSFPKPKSKCQKTSIKKP